MWNMFTFSDGSNPYITKTNKAFWDMICKYNIDQVAEHGFNAFSTLPAFKHCYRDCKYILRDFAVMWQQNFDRFDYSYGDLSEWQDFFTEYGRKYGLLTEFRENCIC